MQNNSQASKVTTSESLVVRGLVAFAATGAITALDIGLLRAPENLLNRIGLNWQGLSVILIGALVGFLFGAVVWGIAGTFPKCISWIWYVNVLWATTAIGAVFGLITSTSIQDRKFDSPDPDRARGMMWGALAGAAVGVLTLVGRRKQSSEVKASPDQPVTAADEEHAEAIIGSTSADEFNDPRLDPKKLQIVRGLWAIIGAGAITGLCVGLYRSGAGALTPAGGLPIMIGISYTLGGAAIALFLGSFLWGIASDSPNKIRLLRFLSFVWLFAAAGAGIGWRVGVELGETGTWRLDRPAGMWRGAMAGAIVGAIIALFAARRRQRVNTAALRSDDSASRLNDD